MVQATPQKQKEKSYYSDKVGPAFAVLAVATIAFSLSSHFHNNSVDSDRTHDAMMAAGKACSLSVSNPDLGESFRQACVEVSDKVIYEHQAEFDSRKFWFPDVVANRKYAQFVDRIRTDLPKFAQFEYAKWSELNDENLAFEDQVRAIEIKGDKPFSRRSVSTELDKIETLSPAANKQPRYTGNFTITLPDSGTELSRSFSYEHVTGMMTQTIGKREVTVFLGVSGDVFTADGKLKHVEDLPEGCRNETELGCAVILAGLQAINNFSPDKIDMLRENIAKKASYNADHGDASKTTVYRVVHDLPLPVFQ